MMSVQGWLMTNLSPDPVAIATIQATFNLTLPVFLLALPAGDCRYFR